MMYAGDISISHDILQLATEQTRQLTFTESAHVYAILKTTLEKLSLVGAIVVDPSTQAAELTASVGEEITRMIAEQKELEVQFQQLISTQQQLRTQPNKAKLRENQAQLQDVAEKLRTATKTLCRNLKDNPNVADNMAKVASERQALQMLLGNCLTDLEGRQRAQPLIEAVLALEHAEMDKQDTFERERSTSAAVKQLRNELRDERQEHDDKMREKHKVMAVLKEELKESKLTTAVDLRYLGKSVAAENECLARLERTTVLEMQHELALTRQQLDIERSVHQACGDYLKKLSSGLQEQSIAWSQRHDDDLSAREKELETVRVNHQRALVALKEIEEKYREELSKRNGREELQRANLAASEEDAMHEMLRKKAALRIQAAWRGFKVRNAASSSKKGAKKGGKKKKK